MTIVKIVNRYQAGIIHNAYVNPPIAPWLRALTDELRQIITSRASNQQLSGASGPRIVP